MILWFAAAAAVGGSLAARASRRRGEASGEQVPPAAARVALLSTDRLDWDAKLSFAALEAAAGSGGTLVRFSGTMPGQVAPRALLANASVLGARVTAAHRKAPAPHARRAVPSLTCAR